MERQFTHFFKSVLSFQFFFVFFVFCFLCFFFCNSISGPQLKQMATTKPDFNKPKKWSRLRPRGVMQTDGGFLAPFLISLWEHSHGASESKLLIQWATESANNFFYLCGMNGKETSGSRFCRVFKYVSIVHKGSVLKLTCSRALTQLWNFTRRNSAVETAAPGCFSCRRKIKNSFIQNEKTFEISPEMDGCVMHSRVTDKNFSLTPSFCNFF